MQVRPPAGVAYSSRPGGSADEAFVVRAWPTLCALASARLRRCDAAVAAACRARGFADLLAANPVQTASAIVISVRRCRSLFTDAKQAGPTHWLAASAPGSARPRTMAVLQAASVAHRGDQGCCWRDKSPHPPALEATVIDRAFSKQAPPSSVSSQVMTTNSRARPAAFAAATHTSRPRRCRCRKAGANQRELGASAKPSSHPRWR